MGLFTVPKVVLPRRRTNKTIAKRWGFGQGVDLQPAHSFGTYWAVAVKSGCLRVERTPTAWVWMLYVCLTRRHLCQCFCL